MSEQSSHSDGDAPLPARRLTKEEEYLYEQSYKEPVESLARIEEVAKFLAGATATTSGLFLAAYRIALGGQAAPDAIWYLPFVAWALALGALVGVVFPRAYEVDRNSPGSYRAALLRARKVKYALLCLGAFLFAAGILLGVVPLRS